MPFVTTTNTPASATGIAARWRKVGFSPSTIAAIRVVISGLVAMMSAPLAAEVVLSAEKKSRLNAAMPTVPSSR